MPPSTLSVVSAGDSHRNLTVVASKQALVHPHPLFFAGVAGRCTGLIKLDLFIEKVNVAVGEDK